MKREDIEASPKISAVSKLIVEWLARHKVAIYTSAEIGKALGMHPSMVAEANHEARGAGLLERRTQQGTPIPLAELQITTAARDAYAPPSTKRTAA